MGDDHETGLELAVEFEHQAEHVLAHTPGPMATNVATTDTNEPWWEDLDARIPALDWKGNKFDPTSPFGGYKESGVGREGGLHGLDAYVRLEAGR